MRHSRPTRLILPALLLAAALIAGAYVLRSHAAPAATESAPRWEYARLIVPTSGEATFVEAELTSTIVPPQNAPTRRTFHQRPQPTRYTANSRLVRDNLAGTLNYLGQQGWEAVEVIHDGKSMTVLMKRVSSKP
jgi:hypothetical protein